MNYFLILISFFTVLSCSISPKQFGELTQEEQRIKTIIASVDNKIAGSFGGRKAKGDFSNLNEGAYSTHLSELTASRAVEIWESRKLVGYGLWPRSAGRKRATLVSCIDFFWSEVRIWSIKILRKPEVDQKGFDC